MKLRAGPAKNSPIVDLSTQDDGPIAHPKRPFRFSRFARNPVVALSTAAVVAVGGVATFAAKASSGSGLRSTTRVERVDPQPRQERAFTAPPAVQDLTGKRASLMAGQPDMASQADIKLVDFAPGSNYGLNHVRVCGIVTCSVYYSHDATVQAAEQMDRVDPAAALDVAAALCDTATLANEGLAPGCLLLSTIAFGNSRVKDILDHAAQTAGCVRFRSLDGVNNAAPNSVYADHSDICHSMDSPQPAIPSF